MNYSDHAYMVRADFYQTLPNGTIGKWYATEAVSMEGLYDENLLDEALVKALVRHFGYPRRLTGMIAVFAEPHHRNAHPMAVRVP